MSQVRVIPNHIHMYITCICNSHRQRVFCNDISTRFFLGNKNLDATSYKLGPSSQYSEPNFEQQTILYRFEELLCRPWTLDSKS